jgi:hypothetical protein
MINSEWPFGRKETELRKASKLLYPKNKGKVIYGLYQIQGNHNPYFSITYEEISPYRRNDPIVACGYSDEMFANIAPELAYLSKWHLSSVDGPMHYEANSLFWHDWAKGEQAGLAKPEHSPKTCLKRFKSCCNWGEIGLEKILTDDQILAMSHAEMARYLNDRLPALIQLFKRDMRLAGFDIP